MGIPTTKSPNVKKTSCNIAVLHQCWYSSSLGQNTVKKKTATFCTERGKLYFPWDASMEVNGGKTEASD